MRPSLRLPFYATSKRLGKYAVKGAGELLRGRRLRRSPASGPRGPGARCAATPRRMRASPARPAAAGAGKRRRCPRWRRAAERPAKRSAAEEHVQPVSELATISFKITR